MSKREHRRNVLPPRIVPLPLSPSDDATGRHRQQREHEPRRYQGGWDIFLFLASLFVLMIGLLVVCNLLLASVPIDSPRVQPTVTVLDFEAVVIVLAVMVGAAFVGYSAIRRIRTTTARAASHNNVADSMQHDKDDAKADQRRAAAIAHNAKRAVRRAGHNLANMPLLLDDIGVIAYHDSVHPSIIRTGAVVTDSTHLQPFVVLTPRLEQAGRVTVSFNLIDEQGNVCYTSQAGYTLQDGQNFVTPNTWLQLAGTPIGSGTWSLHVSLDDQPPLAIHEFGWREPVQLQFGSDGEIDKHTKKLMKQNRALADDEPLSLDDLLAEQKGNSS